MSENVVTSDKSAPKKATPAKKKVDTNPTKELNERDKPIAIAPEGHKFIYFSSGSAYVSVNGRRFSKDQRLNIVTNEEAEYLLKLSNFRLPDQLELEEYAKEI